MSTSTHGSGPDLPDLVTNALDDVEDRLPADDTADDPALRALIGRVAEYLGPRLRDPLTCALLSRPRILAFCVRTAVQADPGQEEPSSVSVRRSPPLRDDGEPAEADEPAAGRRARRGTKGSGS